MIIDTLAPKFKKQYENMSANSRNLLNILIDECERKSLKQTSTETPDYRFFVYVGTNSKSNYCLIKLNTDLIKIHLRTDGYNIIRRDNVAVNKLERCSYNGDEWYEIILESEEQIGAIIDYIVQVRREHVKSLV